MGILFCHLRIIYPACAGVNPITRGTGFGVENTPRMRGGNLAVARCQKVYFYFPRMRGGQPRTPSPFEGDIGFTPHARGLTRSNRVDDTGGTILPACAGVNPRNGYGQFRWNDSPRMRGGHPFARVALRASLFTPHARGSTLPQIAYYVATRIHPACAGINPDDSGSIQNQKDSPRTRGGQPHVQVQWLYDDAFTPHARGST